MRIVTKPKVTMVEADKKKVDSGPLKNSIKLLKLLDPELLKWAKVQYAHSPWYMIITFNFLCHQNNENKQFSDCRQFSFCIQEDCLSPSSMSHLPTLSVAGTAKYRSDISFLPKWAEVANKTFQSFIRNEEDCCICNNWDHNNPNANGLHCDLDKCKDKCKNKYKRFVSSYVENYDD